MPRGTQQQLKSLLQDGWSLEKELEGKGMIVLQGYDAMNNRFVGDVYTRGGINFPCRRVLSAHSLLRRRRC